jgi:pimeloyl-ACP methyl ester carboxylesterase
MPITAPERRDVPSTRPRNGSTPTVLLVHDAFADASSWSSVIGELLAAGLELVAPANPLRGLVSDGRYIASVAEEIDGPVLPVGHGYGGAVIGVAGALAPNILGLAYVSGFALDTGQSILDVSNGFPSTLLKAALRVASFPDATVSRAPSYTSTERRSRRIRRRSAAADCNRGFCHPAPDCGGGVRGEVAVGGLEVAAQLVRRRYCRPDHPP